eukprot:CAMPEP_0167752918 /NCGR_PEP_ID=MMETSP0110_2-20121227/7415_1 /TAXON_ID=629695 /ORGANISM="Gymnochlora sp., Strain CCMP2014" /LENGTH=217 /DNA_ID=CAMNT_0007638607 /DNA_START=417 /DNA_END=1070 /DNA_ORIENTATION=-
MEDEAVINELVKDIRIPKKKLILSRIRLTQDIQCSLCGKIHYKLEFFYGYKEKVPRYSHNGISAIRCRVKCFRCAGPIVMRTDPKTSSIVMESGAVQVFPIETKTLKDESSSVSKREVTKATQNEADEEDAFALLPWRPPQDLTALFSNLEEIAEENLHKNVEVASKGKHEAKATTNNFKSVEFVSMGGMDEVKTRSTDAGNGGKGMLKVGSKKRKR